MTATEHLCLKRACPAPSRPPAAPNRNVWASCEFVHNHFVEARDAGLYLAPDRILAAEARC
jgi:hypothetical protein